MPQLFLPQEKQLKAPVPPLHGGDRYKQHQNCVQGNVFMSFDLFLDIFIHEKKNPQDVKDSILKKNLDALLLQ